MDITLPLTLFCSILLRGATARQIVGQPGLQIMPGCGDGMGARLIEEAGFRTGFQHRRNAPGDAQHGPADLSGNG